MLSAVDKRRDKRLLSDVLDPDPTHEDIRAFLGRLKTALTARAFTLVGITTDGSALSPEPLAALLHGVPPQIGVLHVLAEVGKAVRGAVASVRKRLAAQQPKWPKGRPRTPAAQAAAHQKKRLAQQRVDVYTYRQLFVQRHLSHSARKPWWRITRGLAQLRPLRERMTQGYALCDRRCRTQTALDKFDRRRRRLLRFPQVGDTLKKLFSPTLEKALTFLDDTLLPSTSNAVERGNRRSRKMHKHVDRVRTQAQIRARLALDMWREAQAAGRQQTLTSLHHARAGYARCLYYSLKMRRPEAMGKETAIGDTVLDLERLRQNRVIMTNYETITNYQHSFARMTSHWSVVVTDEAQEYKTPSTKISHALKSLYPRLLRIACTGTPVETRLLDVWNLFDFLQPGHLLNSAAAFAKQYETPLTADDPTNAVPMVTQLKELLHFGRPDAFLIRRDKTSLPDLPAKHEHPLRCHLSPKQRDDHLEILRRAHTGGEENHPLRLLPHLMSLTQHPALVPRYEPIEAAEALAQCPKLQTVLDCLRAIKAKGEKVLIFTRTLAMQQLLATVIDAKLGLHVDIINGATSRRGDTRSGSQTRRAMVQRFRGHPGFNVIVLSPEVAGIGLTLVEANHVIHYGRWWNPAKESQATDRVYRIGQTRDVHVYYPIATDPEGAFETFDEKLDALIQRRRQLAQNFLAPMPEEEALKRELFADLFAVPEGVIAVPPAQPLSPEDVRRLSPEHFEALVAALEERDGTRVLLTPHTADGGIDVVAVQPQAIRLIQCKHTSGNTPVDADVINEVKAALDVYRARWLATLPLQRPLRLVIVTNGEATRQAQSAAAGPDVEIITAKQLWHLLAAARCTYYDVLALEDQRLASMRELPEALRRALST